MNTVQCEFWHEACQTDDLLSQETCKHECILIFLSSKLKVKAVGMEIMTSGTEFMKTLMER